MWFKLGPGLKKMDHVHINPRVHKKDLAQVPTPHPQKPRTETIQGKLKFLKEGGRIRELSATVIKLLKQTIGSLLFYGRVVDMKILVSQGTLVSSQFHVTE